MYAFHATVHLDFMMGKGTSDGHLQNTRLTLGATSPRPLNLEMP